MKKTLMAIMLSAATLASGDITTSRTNQLPSRKEYQIVRPSVSIPPLTIPQEYKAKDGTTYYLADTNRIVVDFKSDAYLLAVAENLTRTGTVNRLLPAVSYGYKNNGVLGIDEKNTNKAPAFFFKMNNTEDTNITYHVQGRCNRINCTDSNYLENLATNLFTCMESGGTVKVRGEVKVYGETPSIATATNQLRIMNAYEILIFQKGATNPVIFDTFFHPHLQKY